MAVNNNEFQQLVSEISDTKEGLNLGLASMGDVLERVDKTLSKMEARDAQGEEEQQHEELRKHKEEFAKEIASMTLDIMKKDGMDVDGKTMRSVNHEDVFDSGGGVGDEQENDDVTTDIKDVQRPLQLMRKEMREQIKKEFAELRKHMLKEHAAQYEGDLDDDGHMDMGGVEEDVMMEDTEGGMDLGFDEDMDEESEEGEEEMGEWGVEESADYPVDEEDDFDKMYKAILKNPKKFNAKTLQKFMQKKATKQAESILKQNGFVKDRNHQPRKSNGNSKTLGAESHILGQHVNKSGQGTSSNPLVDVVKANSNRSWEALAQDYVEFHDPKIPTGIITDEMREIYGD